jgi:hypothetical protein
VVKRIGAIGAPTLLQVIGGVVSIAAGVALAGLAWTALVAGLGVLGIGFLAEREEVR